MVNRFGNTYSHRPFVDAASDFVEIGIGWKDRILMYRRRHHFTDGARELEPKETRELIKTKGTCAHSSGRPWTSDEREDRNWGGGVEETLEAGLGKAKYHT